MGDSDVQLVERAIAGDTAALSTLLELHAAAVRSGLQIDRRWSGELEADDVMQVTFLEAFLRVADFRPAGPGAFLAWLRRIADNNLRDAVKGLQRQKRPPPARRLTALASDSATQLCDLLRITTTTPSRVAAGGEIQSAVRDALAALPEDYAAVVRLCDLEGQPAGDVARALGRSPGAVHMLRSRAHVHLRALLGSHSRFFSRPA